MVCSHPLRRLIWLSYKSLVVIVYMRSVVIKAVLYWKRYWNAQSISQNHLQYLISTSLLVQQFLEELHINQPHSKLLCWKLDSLPPLGKTLDHVRSHLYTFLHFRLDFSFVLYKDASLFFVIFVWSHWAKILIRFVVFDLPFWTSICRVYVSETTLIFTSFIRSSPYDKERPC